MKLLEDYFNHLSQIKITGAGVKETSYYGALETLLNEIGETLTPKVCCIINLKNQGVGLPDGGLFTAQQFQNQAEESEPFEVIFPERGVIEIKGTGDNINKIIQSEQVDRYWQRYRQVLVTNYREFVLIGEDKEGNKLELERYQLAESEQEFWEKTKHPRKFALEVGGAFIEYLKRVLLNAASLNSPQDVAWFLASYGRDAKYRLDQKADLPALTYIRQAIEDALGLKFEGDKGNQFFRSTLVQTLFYGVFSAWVLWHKQNPKTEDQFSWKESAYYLHVPMLQSLFYQLSDPRKLKDLNLVEVLDWTGSALNRVNREAFFTQFAEDQAVQYFYEPFLEAFDPQLRKELGVWYTPPEIVSYMVSRVDRVLREELNIIDGLANEDVYILDPCCGTGTYLVEVLKKISIILEEKGEGALSLSQVKEAAKKRIFGFEILTAPFVIAHLQLGLVLQKLGVPLAEETERVGVYLTNALTGWQPPDEEGKKRIQQLELSFPELKKERDAADEVKRGKPILVILGNPPYNAYAGTSPVEENGLVEVYKEGLMSEWGIKRFNLDDLYVRFFRLAERCITQSTGKGIVCYISNFSYLSYPSFVLMRQRFINEFDQLWFDCMNGDSRETGKVTPDGKPDPSVFSTDYNKAGIKVGTAISLMVRKEQRSDQSLIHFRHFWGVTKRQDLLNSLTELDFNSGYEMSQPEARNRYNFRPVDVQEYYYEWGKLTEFCAISPSNGLMEKRGGDLMDLDRENLSRRMQAYFDANLDWENYQALNYGLTEKRAGFDPKIVRKKALSYENFNADNIVRYLLRPFDTHWCYYTALNPIWNSSRPKLWAQCWEGNQFLMTRPKGVASLEGIPFYYTGLLGDNDFLRGHAYYIPFQLKNGTRLQKKDELTLLSLLGEKPEEEKPFANLSEKARNYLTQIEITNPDENKETASLLWMHCLAIGYSPQYLKENEDGIRQDFPRIPLPNTQALLVNSSNLGQQIALLLETEIPLNSSYQLHQTILPLQSNFYKKVGIISRVGGGQLNPNEGHLTLNAGWGHSGKNNVTMPGKGKLIQRNYTPEELTAMEQTCELLDLTTEDILEQLGYQTCDVYLNEIAYWKNIPLNVWNYTIGGYQVIKKWLSYRDEKILERSLTIEEVREVSNMVKRLTAIVLLQPQLNHNYQMIKQHLFNWTTLET